MGKWEREGERCCNTEEKKFLKGHTLAGLCKMAMIIGMSGIAVQHNWVAQGFGKGDIRVIPLRNSYAFVKQKCCLWWGEVGWGTSSFS